MLVGVSTKHEFGRWNFDVVRFPNLESANFWLNKEQYDFRERFLFDDEKEAIADLMEYGLSKYRAKRLLELASTLTLVNGELEAEFSQAYINKQMGWE